MRDLSIHTQTMTAGVQLYQLNTTSCTPGVAGFPGV